MSDFETLRKQYEYLNDICSAAVVLYEDADSLSKSFSNEIMFRVFRVWSAQPGFHEDYIGAIKTINSELELSQSQICEFIDRTKALHFVPIMQQFVYMTATENLAKEPFCRHFIDKLVDFLTDMAFVNGDCTPEEADEIEQIRMMHMDFYNEFNLIKRRVMSDAIPAGKFRYNRFGIDVEWELNRDGIITLNSKKQETITEAALEPDDQYRAASEISDELFSVDMRAAEPTGITDISVHGWWHDNELVINGQMYSDGGLKKDFDLTAALFDKDGDIITQDSNRGYGGGGITSSMIRKKSFFPGYPFQFYFLNPVNKKDDIAKIKITFNS